MQLDIHVQGFDMALVKIPDPDTMSRRILTAWANKARERARFRASSGRSAPDLYLHIRNPNLGFHNAIQAGLLSNVQAVLKVTHPGAKVHDHEGKFTIKPRQEFAGVNKKGKPVLAYLRFRLYLPSDTFKPTGPWIRTREVNITGRGVIQRSGEEASLYVMAHLADILGMN